MDTAPGRASRKEAEKRTTSARLMAGIARLFMGRLPSVDENIGYDGQQHQQGHDPCQHCHHDPLCLFSHTCFSLSHT